MSLITELSRIQSELKAPKNQVNSFGKYKYRSCEDILEAVKPLLNGLVLTVSDEMVAVGDRVYVKATCTITDGKDTLLNTGFAREAATKKGMDDSQITGAASSYARKYSLNGLFLIDDTQDSDATNTHGKQAKAPVKTSELANVMSDGNDLATAQFWRTLDQDKQSKQWQTIDKPAQNTLKAILGSYPA